MQVIFVLFSIENEYGFPIKFVLNSKSILVKLFISPSPLIHFKVTKKLDCNKKRNLVSLSNKYISEEYI